MKNVVLVFMLMISSLLMSAQNPLGWNEGNFPIKNYLINKTDTENTWYKKGDSIYSIFKMDNAYYANGVKWSKSSKGFAMAFANAGDVPVKNGFFPDDTIYWGRCRNGVITQINLIKVYKGELGEYAIFAETERILTVLDNPYYSLDPIWPPDTIVKIKTPVTTKSIRFSDLGFEKTITPKWTSGWFVPVLSETKAILKTAKNKDGLIFLNASTIRFSKQDVQQGYFYLTIKATLLKNSKSTITEKKYKIHW